MLIPHGALIMVLDGAKMVLLRNRGTDTVPDLEPFDHREHQAAKTAELGTDRPGRSAKSQGHARSAHQSADFHQAEEDEFAQVAIQTLNALAGQADLDFIVVAAPHVLGLIRKHYSADLRAKLVGEIDKDYASRSATDIAAMLRDHRA